MTVSEFLEQQQEYQERLAVWQIVREHLQSEYLPRDERGPKKSIALDALANPATARLVRPETIDKMVAEIEAGPLLSLEIAILQAESQQILETPR